MLTPWSSPSATARASKWRPGMFGRCSAPSRKEPNNGTARWNGGTARLLWAGRVLMHMHPHLLAPLCRAGVSLSLLLALALPGTLQHQRWWAHLAAFALEVVLLATPACLVSRLAAAAGTLCLQVCPHTNGRDQAPVTAGGHGLCNAVPYVPRPVADDLSMPCGPPAPPPQASLAPAYYRPRRTLILTSCRLAAAALPRHSAPLRLRPSAMQAGSWGGWTQFLLFTGALVSRWQAWGALTASRCWAFLRLLLLLATATCGKHSAACGCWQPLLDTHCPDSSGHRPLVPGSPHPPSACRA